MPTADDGRGFRLKPLHHEAVPAALVKAERYRLLNEPRQAESICRDILRVEPDNQEALVVMILALTDQFPRDLARKYAQAKELLPRLEGEYEHVYYSGIICERRAKAQHAAKSPRAGHVTYDWLREAMHFYEKAEKLAPPGNDDALLRWNTCVRIIRAHPEIEPDLAEETVPHFLE